MTTLWQETLVTVLRLILLIVFVSSAATPALCQPAGVVINEVLADPISESTGEFVELFNTGSEPVDLEDWVLADVGDRNDTIADYVGPYDAGSPGTVIPPGGFALIVDPDYAGEYLEAILANADLNGLILITIKGDRTLGNGLGNTTDRITLFSPQKDSVSFEWLHSSGAESVSWERRLVPRADSENWFPSRAAFGSTPGYRNSVAPASRDLSLAPVFSTTAHLPGVIGVPVVLRVRLRNEGIEPLEDLSVGLYPETTADSVLAATTFSGFLASDDSTDLILTWTPRAGGMYRLLIRADTDGDTIRSNNEFSFQLGVSFDESAVVINEILFDPGPERPEWIELYNRSSHAIDLASWTLVGPDTLQRRVIVDSSLVLAPQTYGLLVEDREAFSAVFPNATGLIIRPKGGWPTLRNAGARIAIRDATGQQIDAVTYAPEWGGTSGQSIERISLNRDSQDAGNWGVSAGIRGASPGEVNTLFAESVSSKMLVEIEPNPFSPDGDGHEDVAAITMRLPTTRATLRVLVFDLAGRRVKTLLNDAPSGARRSVVWDGTDDLLRRLPVGPYLLYCQMVPQGTGTYATGKHLVVVAKPMGREHYP